MSDTTPTAPTGLLTPTERQFLLGDRSDNESVSDEAVYRQARDRLAASTLDFQALYCGLRDEDIEMVFDDESNRTTATPFHDALVFLFYSMLQTDRQPEVHIERALRHAYAAMDQHASTRVDIVAEPFLPPRERLEAVTSDGIGRVSIDALEQLYYDESVPPEAFDDVRDDTELLPSGEEVRQIRTEVADLERVPLSVVVDVDVAPADTDGSERE